jgi:hypothetical protein
MKHASFIIVAAVALVACGGDKAAAPVIVPPVLDSISPSRGTVGTLVRLNGSTFANDSVRVYFGALASPQVERQSGVLYATAPEGLVLERATTSALSIATGEPTHSSPHSRRSRRRSLA